MGSLRNITSECSSKLMLVGSEEAPTEYTLRRSCAQTLDHIAVELRDALLPHVLPIVEQYLSDNDWRLREAAILALGAVADGCAEGLRPHVPGILQLLLGKTSDAQPNVRCNSCWALGRYAAFRIQDAVEGDNAAGAEVEHIIRSLLERSQVFYCRCHLIDIRVSCSLPCHDVTSQHQGVSMSGRPSCTAVMAASWNSLQVTWNRYVYYCTTFGRCCSWLLVHSCT